MTTWLTVVKWTAILAVVSIMLYLITGFFDDLRERYTESGRIEERAKWQEAQLAIISWSQAQREDEQALAKKAAKDKSVLLDELETLRNTPEKDCSSISANTVGLLNDAARAYNCKHFPDDSCSVP
jgi:hypothetical protein